MDPGEAFRIWFEYMKGHFENLLMLVVSGIALWIGYWYQQRKVDKYWAEKYNERYRFETPKEEIARIRQGMIRQCLPEREQNEPVEKKDEDPS